MKKRFEEGSSYNEPNLHASNSYDSSSHNSRPYDSRQYDSVPYDGVHIHDSNSYNPNSYNPNDYDSNTYAPNSYEPSVDESNGHDSHINKGSQKKKPINRRKIAFYIAGGLVLLIALCTLPLPIGTIRITGSQTITEKDVIAIGELSTPVNILSVRRSRLEERLQQDLRVETAKVTYQLPLVLDVAIEERKALLVGQTQFGYVSIDRKGQIIHTGPAIADTKATILSGVKLGNVLLGDVITNESILGAMKYLEALSPEERARIGEINVGDSEGLVAYTIEGLPIHIGDLKDLPEKARLTGDMLSDLKAKHIRAQYINVNVKSPFYKVQ